MLPLTEHFTLEEMITTSFRCYDNTPDEATVRNLSRLAAEQLEPIRALLGCPIIVTSGFRCRDIECAIRGGTYPERGSQHSCGCAADIIPSRVPVKVAYETILDSGIPFDQLILEVPPKSSGWVHISRPLPGKPWRSEPLVYDGKAYYPWRMWNYANHES